MQDDYPDYYRDSGKRYGTRCTCPEAQSRYPSETQYYVKLHGTDKAITTCAYCDRVLKGVGCDPPPVPICDRDELAEAIAQRDKFRRKVESLALLIVIIYLTTIEGSGILHLEAAHEPDRRCQTVRNP
jgi:hypothetical protein